MSDKKTAVLIPVWILETLKRNNLPLSACLDLEKIKSILSLNDLATFLSIQDDRYMKLLTGVNEHLSQLSLIWSDGIPKSNPELKTFFWETLSVIAKDAAFHKEITSRLFSEETNSNQYEEPFTIYDLTPEVYGIVIYPGHFITDNNIELQRAVVEAILEVSYVYASFHDVARTPFFKRYLELLSIKKS